jgi:hypothetical protein
MDIVRDRGSKGMDGCPLTIWIHCLCPQGMVFSLLDWVFVEGIVQDSSDSSQVSDCCYGVCG